MKRRVEWLENHGFFVGKRDPKLNRAFKGKFMVCDKELLTGPPTDDASEGGFCIVGDNLTKLVVEAVEHNDWSQ